MKYADKVKKDEERYNKTVALNNEIESEINNIANEIKGDEEVTENELTPDEKKAAFKKKSKRILKIVKTNHRVQIFLLVVLIILVIIITLLVSAIKTIRYHSTDEYKLLQKGYTEAEVTNILTFPESDIEYILNHDYNASLDDFIQEKYFMYANVDKYLTYIKAYPNTSISDVVAYVNTNRDREFYSDTENTDISLNEEMLVNKYYLLAEDYEPSDLESIPLSYALGNYGDVQLSHVALEQFEALCQAARKEGHTIVANVGYRTYARQNELWTDYQEDYGTDYADEVAARPGASEHQTGLAVNVLDFNDSTTAFDKTSAYTWMCSHAHEYGFILRYPNGKSDITGFAFEPGHFRYVGVEAATKIYNEGITFEEYYAYYILGKN